MADRITEDPVRATSPIQIEGHRARPFRKRLLDAWFAPKRFESTALYERLGVLLVKQYAPTGGDFFIRRYGVRIADVRAGLESLVRFERLTRRLEAIHEIAFLAFLAWSVWRAATRRTRLRDLGFATAVYIVLILSPAILQRYNRLRVYAAIRHRQQRQMQSPERDTAAYSRTAAGVASRSRVGDRASSR